MLWRALKNVVGGCYVDVGAAEPEADSVTHAFYLRSWRGVNIEPTSGAFARLAAARPEDTNLNIAVGDREGTTKLFLVDGGNGLSTTRADLAEHLGEQGWTSTQAEVEVRTLASIINQHVHGPVHFLKVDAEGSERAVLAGADLRGFRPWIILVEATAPNSQIPTHQDWEDLLVAADYRFVWFDGLNRFYLALEREDLADAFLVQPNVFDGFVRQREANAVDDLTGLRTAYHDLSTREQQITAIAQAQELAIAEIRHSEAKAVEELTGLRTAYDDLSTREQQITAVAQAQGLAMAEMRQGAAVDLARITAERDAWAQ